MKMNFGFLSGRSAPPKERPGGSSIGPPALGPSVVDAPEVAFLILAAEAVGFRRLCDGRHRADIGSRFGEIRDAMLRRLIPVSCAGAPSAGRANSETARVKPRAIGALNETLILISYRVIGVGCRAYLLLQLRLFGDRLCITIVLLRRLQLRAIYSKVLQKILLLLEFGQAKLASSGDATISDHRTEGGGRLGRELLERPTSGSNAIVAALRRNDDSIRTQRALARHGLAGSVAGPPPRRNASTNSPSAFSSMSETAT